MLHRGRPLSAAKESRMFRDLKLLNRGNAASGPALIHMTTALHEQLDAAALALLRSEKEELIKIAKPFMANLYKFVQGSGFVVVLTDERGYIMEMFADGDTDDNPLTSNFFPGASWREEEAGTNAIGTALKIGEPIQVSGAEHYCQKHHWLTCSAAPIFDNQGNINGVLDMSGVSYMSHLSYPRHGGSCG